MKIKLPDWLVSKAHRSLAYPQYLDAVIRLTAELLHMLAVQEMLLRDQPENAKTLSQISLLQVTEQKKMITCDPSLAMACAALILPSGVASFAKCRQSCNKEISYIYLSCRVTPKTR